MKSSKSAATIIAPGAGMLASGATAAESVDMYDGQWHFGATLYAWFPNINDGCSDR